MNCNNKKCNKEHDGSYGSGRFCSRKCARSFSTQERRQEINRKVSNTLTGKPSKLRGRYNQWRIDTHIKVSQAHKIRNENKRQLIMKTLPFKQWPSSLIKMYLFKEIGNRCEECGFEYTDPITGKGPFEPHHKDGNKCNWKRENLEILCLNCHWKTPFWKFKNRKHKRESIEKGLRTKELKNKLGA